MGWLAVPFLLLMVVVAFGMGGSVFKMAFGNIPANYIINVKPAYYAYTPQVILLIILLFIGINVPQQVYDFMNNAAGFFK